MLYEEPAMSLNRSALAVICNTFLKDYGDLTQDDVPMPPHWFDTLSSGLRVCVASVF